MIWLIGNKGMLGTKLSQLLKANNIDIIESDREVDILKPEELERFIENRDITWIINCSAYTAVDQAETDTDRAYAINRDGLVNITKVCRDKHAKLIHISTDYVFDGNSSEPYQEDDEVNPQGVYGKSKQAGEKIILESLSRSFIIRTSWLFGEAGNNFVATMLRLMSERDELGIINDQFGRPTYTGDLAEAILHLLSIDSAEYGIYHYSNSGITSWYEFSKSIYEMATKMGILTKKVRIKPITTDDYPTKAKRPMYSVLSTDKIENKLNIQIRSWQECLHDYLTNIQKV